MKRVGICKSEIQAQGFLGNGMQIGLRGGKSHSARGRPGASEARTLVFRPLRLLGQGASCSVELSQFRSFNFFFKCVCHRLLLSSCSFCFN